jgi:hypothetical protein
MCCPFDGQHIDLAGDIPLQKVYVEILIARSSGAPPRGA